MEIRNLRSQSQGLNVGKIASPLFPGLVISGLLVPKSWVMTIGPVHTAQDVVDMLMTEISALLINDDYASRAFYVGKFVGFDDKSEATQYQTFGYGIKVPTQRQITAKEYQIYDGGLEYFNALKSFSGKINQYAWVEIDQFGNVGLTDAYDSTGTLIGCRGVSIAAWLMQDRKQANKSTVEEWKLHVEIADGAEVNENAFIIETNMNFDDFVSPLMVVDISTVPVGAMASHVQSYRVVAGDGGVDIVETLPGMCVAANLVAHNVETGVAVGITSVALVGNRMNVTYNTSSSGWDVGVEVALGFDPVSDLATAGYSYYECASVAAMGRSAMVA